MSQTGDPTGADNAGAENGVVSRGQREDISDHSSPSEPPMGLIGQPPSSIQVLFDAANRAGRFSLIAQIAEHIVVDGEALPDLNVLWPILLGALKRSRSKGDAGPLWPPRRVPSSIELIIDSVEAPATWLPGREGRVHFTVRNNTSQPTSGFVHGSVTQGASNQLLSAAWWQLGNRIPALPAGSTFSGTLGLHAWTHNYAAPGSADVNLQYWVEDPQGTLTVVRRLPDGTQTDVTFSAVSFAADTIPVVFKSFAADIRPLFRDSDIAVMQGQPDFPLDLSSYEEVKTMAVQIWQCVSYMLPTCQMPCDEKWPDQWVARFKNWMDNGMLP